MKPSHWTALAVYLADMRHVGDDNYYWVFWCLCFAAVSAVYSSWKEKR